MLFVLGVYASSSAAGGDAINAHRASWGLPVPEPQARRSGRRGGTGPCSDSHVAGLLLPGLGPWQGWPGRDWDREPVAPPAQFPSRAVEETASTSLSHFGRATRGRFRACTRRSGLYVRAWTVTVRMFA